LGQWATHAQSWAELAERGTMRTAGRQGLVIAAVVVVLGIGLVGCKVDPGQGARDRILWDHNSARNFAGLPLMAGDLGISSNAQFTAERMRDESGGQGCMLRHSTPAQMSSRYPGRAWGENIGCYPGCANAAGSATRAFLRSAIHRGNILNPNYLSFGVGAACNGRYLFVAVQFTS
jgi:uncharacterized protein YkwD